MTFAEQIKNEKNPAIKRIGEYLLKRSLEDPSVERTIQKENKTLKECWNYILGEISKKIYREGNFGVAAGDDQELFDLAVHYYDEDDIEIKKTNWVKVDTNMGRNQPKQEQSDENKEQDVHKFKHQTKKSTKKKVVKAEEVEEQLSLFEV